MKKSDVHEKVELALGNAEFAKLWWNLKLPGLGMATPNEVWEKDPAQVNQYVVDYSTVE